MWSWSDIHTTTTKRIDTVFRIVIALMLYAQVVSLVTFLVVAVKNTSWGWYNKFEEIAFENAKTFGIPNGRV